MARLRIALGRDRRGAVPGRPGRKRRILVAERDADTRTFLASRLRNAGYGVVELNAAAAVTPWLRSRLPATVCGDARRLAAMAARTVDLMIVDLGARAGDELLEMEDLQSAEGLPRLVFLAARGDARAHVQAHCMRAATVIDRPFTADDLLATVRRVLPSEKLA